MNRNIIAAFAAIAIISGGTGYLLSGSEDASPDQAPATAPETATTPDSVAMTAPGSSLPPSSIETSSDTDGSTSFSA